jgi:hypothetical protein
MKTPIPFFLVALFVSASLQVCGSNYYVDPSSSGSNQGTFTNPWKSIDDIPWYINYFSPGDTVFFKRGQQYTGTLSINSSGSNGAPIVFMPYGSGNAPVFRYNLANPAEAQVHDRMIIRLSQVNYVVIDGFELTDPTTSETDHNVTAHVGYGVYIYAGPGNNGSHNVIKNLTISRLGAGICIDGGNYNTITDCNIRNLRMIINTPDISWDDFGANGIIVSGSDNTITRNHIQDCWSNSYDYQIDGGAIEMYGAVCNNKILYNTAIENLGWMEFGSGSGGQALNNVIGYNLLINNGHTLWINTDGPYGLEVRNLQLFNNNIIETHAHRLADIRNLIGISTTPSVSNVITMKNNIFWLTTPMNISDPTIQPFNGSQLVHQNNLFHMGGGSMGYTLDPSERNLNVADQLFTDITSSNPANWNYNLKLPSAAIDFGQNTGILQDFYGQSVPAGNTPDAGIAENVSLTVLPLQFISCKGWAGTTGNTIEWETTNDIADHFEIEKSNGGNNFKTIAVVPYKVNAGSTTVKYQFIDNKVMGEVQYYRIKVVEPGNTSSYSQIISIKNSLSPNNMIVSPNPAQDYLYLRIPGNDFQNKEMVLVNMSGVELRRSKINEAGNQIKVNVSMLPKGAYVIKLTDYKTGWYQSTIFTK